MIVRVEVPANRQCVASFDYNKYTEFWSMSFGDNKTAGTDVDIKFTQEQIIELKKLVAALPDNQPAEELHTGRC